MDISHRMPYRCIHRSYKASTLVFLSILTLADLHLSIPQLTVTSLNIPIARLGLNNL